MRTTFLFLVGIFFFTFGACGQSLEASLKWLEQHLNYQYFNEDQGKWWLNRLNYDAELRVIRIQNTSADHPKDVRNKQWIHRRIVLNHLDPSTITVEEVPENRGRIVKGSVLHLHTLGGDRLIEKTIDGASATAESFLQFAVPASLTKENSTFIDSLEYHLRLAIDLSARVARTGSVAKDAEVVLQLLNGEFDCPGFTRRYSKVFAQVHEFEDTSGGKVIQKGFFGYDKDEQRFFEWIAGDEIAIDRSYIFLRDDAMVLHAEEGGGELHLESSLQFGFYEYSMEMVCTRKSFD